MMRVEFVLIAMLGAGAMVANAAAQQRGGRDAGQLREEQPAGIVGTNKAPAKGDEIGTQVVEGCLRPSTPGKFRISEAKLLKGSVAGTGKQFTNYQITPVAGDALKDVKLDGHVGHKVQLTGAVVEGSSSDPPRFFMTEFKMVSPTCP
jgi:hypothetical protein